MTGPVYDIIVDYLDNTGTPQTFTGNTTNILHASPGLVYSDPAGTTRTLFPWSRILSVTSDNNNSYWQYWGL